VTADLIALIAVCMDLLAGLAGTGTILLLLLCGVSVRERDWRMAAGFAVLVPAAAAVAVVLAWAGLVA
jgi:hypothetical protein